MHFACALQSLLATGLDLVVRDNDLRVKRLLNHFSLNKKEALTVVFILNYGGNSTSRAFKGNEIGSRNRELRDIGYKIAVKQIDGKQRLV